MASPNKTWTVVCFTADDSVEAVPTRWINGDECLWPAVTREKLHALIKRCEFNSCWPLHKVRSFRNATYDNYALARKKAAKAETTSDLNTEDCDATVTPSKRLRKKKVFSSSDSDRSDSDELPIKFKKIPAPPTWEDKTTHKDMMMNSENENNNSKDDIEYVENRKIQSRSSATPVAKKSGPLQQIEENLANELISAKKSGQLQQIRENSTGNKLTESENRPGCCNSKILYNIQALLVEINEKVTNHKCTTHDDQEIKNILEKSNLDFPIETKETFVQFNKFFSVSENYSALVQLFTKMGGSNLYEFVRRCIAPLVSDTLAEQFSFLGKKGKSVFGSSSLAKAIIDAAQKSGISNNQKEIELRIGDWLRRAKERRVRAETKKN
ncbi:unnamed protein product [Ceutorhynchus assimilis]|uniref:DUF4806 domain-containing protein n=1 Tax=Ceutorhynchus assimilis TaxID=467358 RepID=A0A9N9QLQ3_9CUCU|nr:unnamed protein product [Ceutorhynchus assimilis]CAG9770582.1 unnamed protein product [Ceutorhynchus assimilis]